METLAPVDRFGVLYAGGAGGDDEPNVPRRHRKFSIVNHQGYLIDPLDAKWLKEEGIYEVDEFPVVLKSSAQLYYYNLEHRKEILLDALLERHEGAKNSFCPNCYVLFPSGKRKERHICPGNVFRNLVDNHIIHRLREFIELVDTFAKTARDNEETIIWIHEPGMKMLKRESGTMSQALCEDVISISIVLEQKPGRGRKFMRPHIQNS